MPMMAVSGKSSLLSAGFCIEAHHKCRVAEEGFHFYGEVITLLIIEGNPSANMFYLLKHLLLLILVIFKLKCNNLISNEIMVLNALYLCLLHSRFIKNHPTWILEDGPLISEVVLSQLVMAHKIWIRLDSL
jgi:hypothetical protein